MLIEAVARCRDYRDTSGDILSVRSSAASENRLIVYKVPTHPWCTVYI